MRNKAHELQWLEVMNQRNGLSEEEIKIYQRLKRGYQGEVVFDKLCQVFLENGVEVLNNITLKYKFDTVQIDQLIITGEKMYVVDVKYYRGAYVYENDEWRIGSTILSNNIYEQLRRAKRVVQNIFYEADMKVEIQGVLVFINPESSVEIVDQVPEETLSYEDVSGWLMKLSGENSGEVQPEWKNLLRAFEIESYRTNRVCSSDQFSNLRKGIRCMKCGGFDLSEEWYTVHCSCGHSEAKEIAYVRTICEYGVIMHKEDLKTSDLKEFFGGSNYRYLKRMLRKHFELITSSGNLARYANNGEQFEYSFKDKMDYFNKIAARTSWKVRK